MTEINTRLLTRLLLTKIDIVITNGFFSTRFDRRVANADEPDTTTITVVRGKMVNVCALNDENLGDFMFTF